MRHCGPDNPLNNPPPPSCQPVPDSTEPTSLSVLVVDDTPVVADVLAQLIGMLGHRPTVVHSGSQAIEVLSKRGDAFDVIFSDISMPEMDGHQLAGKIKAGRDEGTVRTRMLIAMSGYSDPEEKERSLASGFDRHVVKPPDVETLEALLAEAAKT